MDAAAQIIQHAQRLLLTYYKHLHAKGAEVTELRAEGVSWSHIASLYPWDGEEWRIGIDRLTRTKPYWLKRSKPHWFQDAERKEGFWTQDIIHPPEFTDESWKAIQALMVLRMRNAPAFARVDEVTHNRYVIIGSSAARGPGDPYVYLEVLVWVLHVLATSPYVSDVLLNEQRIRRAARKVLAKAEQLVPTLDSPQPEPETY